MKVIIHFSTFNVIFVIRIVNVQLFLAEVQGYNTTEEDQRVLEKIDIF